jgi:hypothetical protein
MQENLQTQQTINDKIRSESRAGSPDEHAADELVNITLT